MALQYFLLNNPMTRGERNDRIAVSVVPRTYGIDDVIERMISRGSTVTRAEALSVFEEFSLAVQQLVEEGNSLNTPLFNVAPKVAGVFKNDDDTFDTSRHQVKVRMNPGLRLREIEAGIRVEKIMATKLLPILVHFFDNESDGHDDLVTPGGGAKIVGGLLKFDEADVLQGIFFINTSNGSATRVTAKMLRNKPGELIFTLPESLVNGTYRVEVRTLVKGSKTLRVGALPIELTVSI
jgi:hypothetical protein